MKKLIIASLFVGLSISALASTAAGKWNGKVKFDLSDVKNRIRQESAKATGPQKAKAEADIAKATANEKVFGAAIIKLELNKDGSATISQSLNGKANGDKGKWSQSGNTVKLFNLSGKNGGPTTMSGVLDAKGKTMVFDLSEAMKSQAVKKGAPANLKIKMTITYTKA